MSPGWWRPALKERVRELTLIGVAALGLRADPREPFAKERTGMSAEEIAAVYRQNLAVLMFADPANIDPLAIHLQAENIKRARFRSRPFAATDAPGRRARRCDSAAEDHLGHARHHRPALAADAPRHPAPASPRAARCA